MGLHWCTQKKRLPKHMSSYCSELFHICQERVISVIFSYFNANQQVQFLNDVKTFQLLRKKRYICPFFLIPSQQIRGEKSFEILDQWQRKISESKLTHPLHKTTLTDAADKILQNVILLLWNCPLRTELVIIW